MLAEEALELRRGEFRGENSWIVQYSTVQYSRVQYSTVQYSTVQYSSIYRYGWLNAAFRTEFARIIPFLAEKERADNDSWSMVWHI